MRADDAARGSGLRHWQSATANMRRVRDGRLHLELTCHSHMIALLLALGLARVRRSPTILQKLAVHIFLPYSTNGYIHKARGTEKSPDARYLSRLMLWLRRNPIYALLYLAKQVPDTIFDPFCLQAHPLAACPVEPW